MRRLWMLLLLLCLTACQTAEPAGTLSETDTAKIPRSTIYRHIRTVSRLPLVPPTPPPPVDQLAVQIDPSHLTAQAAEGPLVRYWGNGPQDTFVPSEEYGELVPYIGKSYYSYGYPYVGEGASPNIYGLMTRDGHIVVDSIYSYIRFLTYNNTPLPAMIAFQPRKYAVSYGSDAYEAYHALIATDGSWCIDLTEYRDCTAADEKTIFLQKDSGVCELYDLNGKMISSFSLPDASFSRKSEYAWEDGMCIYDKYISVETEDDGYWYEDVIDEFWLNAFTGELIPTNKLDRKPTHLSYLSNQEEIAEAAIDDLMADMKGEWKIIRIWDDVILFLQDSYSVVMDLEGNTLIRYPLFNTVD